MKPIIATINFTPASLNAAKYGANMAVAAHADLYLLHVISIPESSMEVAMTEEFFNEMRNDTLTELTSVKLQLQQETGGKINIYTALKIGSFENELAGFSSLKNPFAITIGKKKHASGAFLFGSNTMFAVQRLHYPLLVIPEGLQFHAVNKIVLACDLTNPIEAIPVDYLKDLQQVFNASFGVLSVGSKNMEGMKLNNTLASLKVLLQGLHPAYYYSIADTVEKGIATFIEENGADLLLLLPKNHSIFELHRSHTKKILQHTALPVVSIHE
jgi:nucleotide-binding universal stress UspA family protein